MNWRLLDIRHGTLGQVNFALLYVGLWVGFWAVMLILGMNYLLIVGEPPHAFVLYGLVSVVFLYFKTLIEVRRLRDIGLSAKLSAMGILYSVFMLIVEFKLYDADSNAMNGDPDAMWNLTGWWFFLTNYVWFYFVYVTFLVFFPGEGRPHKESNSHDMPAKNTIENMDLISTPDFKGRKT